MRRISTVVILCLLNVNYPSAQTSHHGEEMLENYHKAVSIVEKSVDAFGGLAAFKSVHQLSVCFSGDKFMDGQSLSFNKPNVSLPVSQEFTVDFEKNVVVNETMDRYLGGYLFHFRTVFDDSSGFSYEVPKIRFSTITSLPVSGAGALRQQLLRLLPNYVLKSALDNRSTLRYKGFMEIENRQYEIVSFSYSASLVLDLFIDAQTKLLYKYEFVTASEVHGDIVMEYIYSGYQQVYGMLFPAKRIIRTNKQLLRSESVSVKINDRSYEEKKIRPGNYGKPHAEKPVMREVAANIFLIENINGYNAMCLNFKDHLMVLEAIGGTEEVLKLIRERFPVKPIRYVAISHYHEDHSKGLREYIDAGTTIIAGDQNKSYIKHLHEATHTILMNSSGRPAAEPRIESVSRRRSFSDENIEMEMIDFGPNDHADQLFAFYFPKERILFQADMLISTDKGELSPVIAVNKQLAKRIAEFKLSIDTIYGVHMKPVPMVKFSEALQNASQ